MSSKPWKSGPRELLDHASAHIQDGSPFDYRIALISIDNAVELGIKTFLGLPKRIRGTEGPGRRQLQDAGTSFPDLLDLLEQFGSDRLTGVGLGDIEVYHRLRNTLYHDGNGVTVDPQHVDGYFQVARILLRSLLDIEQDEPPLPDPRTLVGELVTSWNRLEAKLRFQGARHLLKPETDKGPITGVIDGLIKKSVLAASFRSRFEPIRHGRNSIVHGASPPPSPEIRKLIDGLNELWREIPDAGC